MYGTNTKIVDICYTLRILMKLELSRQICSKNTQTSSFVKIHLVGAELFHTHTHTDGRTDGQT